MLLSRISQRNLKTLPKLEIGSSIIAQETSCLPWFAFLSLSLFILVLHLFTFFVCLSLFINLSFFLFWNSWSVYAEVSLLISCCLCLVLLWMVIIFSSLLCFLLFFFFPSEIHGETVFYMTFFFIFYSWEDFWINALFAFKFILWMHDSLEIILSPMLCFLLLFFFPTFYGLVLSFF